MKKKMMALSLMASFFIWLAASSVMALSDQTERVEITTQKLPTGTVESHITLRPTITVEPEPAGQPNEQESAGKPISENNTSKTYSLFSADVTMSAANDRLKIQFDFNTIAISDASVLKKYLKAEELPFAITPPMEVEAIWNSEKQLIVSPKISWRELENLLSNTAVKFAWKPHFRDIYGQYLSYVYADRKTSISPFIMTSGREKASAGARLFSTLEIEPFTVKIDHQSTDESVTVTMNFNRSIVEKNMVGQKLAMSDVPFTLDPPLPLEGAWKNDRSLTMKGVFTRTAFWEQVSDIPFTISWKENKISLDGQPLPPFNQAWNSSYSRPFYFSRFSALGLNQASMNLENWGEFDLGFNKPINAEDVTKHMRAEKFVDDGLKPAQQGNGYDQNSRGEWQEIPMEVLRVGGQLDDYGVRARLRIKAAPNDKIRVIINDLKPADGRGVLEDLALTATVEDYFTISGTNVGVEEKYPWKSYFTINTYDPVNFNDPSNPVEKFIKLEPEADFVVSPYGQDGKTIQIFAPFNAQEVTKVTLLAGLPSNRGVLTKDVSFDVYLPTNSERKLMFTGRGRYLSPQNPLLIKLAGRNVERVLLQGWRIYENNLPTIINVQDYNSNIRTRLTQQFSKSMINRETDTNSPAGEVFERLLDLEQVFGEKPSGAYLLKITPVRKTDGSNQQSDEYDEDYYYDDYYDYSDYYYHTERYLPVMISDLGLAAHVLNGKVTMWVNSLSEARPISGGTVKFYDRANQVIAQGATDAEGLFTAEVPMSRVVFVTVEKDGDLNYMMFGRAARSNWEPDDSEPQYEYDEYDDEYYDYYDDYYYSDWRENSNAKWYGGDTGYLSVDVPEAAGAERDYLDRGYEAFLFLPRDIFKPGETVPVKAMVRDKNILPPSSPFPVLWEIEDPNGRVISQGKADMNAHGGVDFASEIPFSGRTGSYEARIFLPGSSSALGRAPFTVEDFVPPRLAIELETDKKVYSEGNPAIELTSHVKYLFGAPGASLSWEMDAVISTASFYPKGWDGFDFTSPPSDFQTTRQRQIDMGLLNEEGRAVIKYRPNLESSRLPNKMKVEFVFSAQEDGGRWNAKKISVDYFPRPVILGGKAPETTAVKEKFTYEVAAVSPDGTPAEVERLQVEVFRAVYRYYNTYRYGRSYRQSVKELIPQIETKVALTDGRGSIQFTPETAGTYEIKITDPATDMSITRRVEVYGLETAKEAAPKGKVELVFDRESYLPGDEAIVKIKSPFPGRLWLSVETNTLLFSKAMDMATTETEVRIPINSAIVSNAFVSATVIRPMSEGITNYRAIGIGRLEIDRNSYCLNIEADMPDHIKPSAPASLKIKLTDQSGRPLQGEATVSLVDEGVLSLTGFKTPDPWKAFTVSRKLMTLFYDLYDQLLPLEKTTVPFLVPGGGDGIGRSGLFSPFKRKQEVLSIFLASVETGPDGQAEVELNLPEYSGQGRLMIVASSANKFGSTARNIRISRDLTAEATLPLALAPGDKFEIPIRVFLAAEAEAEAGAGASITIRTEGPISMAEKNRAEFNLKPGQGQTEIFKALAEPAEADGDRAGVGRLIIESKSGMGETFSQTIEAVVRPPYPRISTTTSGSITKKETEIKIDTDGYLKGTIEASFTLAKSPAIEAARAVRYLNAYPYGCLEQTTSKAWVFIAAEEMLVGLKQDQSQTDHIRYGLNAAVKRLATMQTTDGGFAMWPGGEYTSDWSTVYAAHFLTEAGRKIDLPAGLKERAVSWLQTFLSADYGSSRDIEYTLATRAYAAYVLALNGEYRAGWINALKDRYEGLLPSARIFLAGAEAVHEGNPRALLELEKKRTDLSLNTMSSYRSSFESLSRNTALKLMIWNEVDPLSSAANDLAMKVAEQGRQRMWSNTQENGMAVYSLATWMTKSGVGKPYTASLSGADGQVLFTTDHKSVATAGPKALAPVQGRPLKLTREGDGKPYYTLTVAAVPTSAPEPKNNELSVIRYWTLQDGTKHNLTTTKDMSRTLNVSKGDRVTVEIFVNASKPMQNMVLVDLLPGGFEIENSRLIAPSADEDEEYYPSPDDPHLDLREDRVVVIEPWMAADEKKLYTYTLRAVTAGEYTLPPTVAEGMYEPHRQSITGGGLVKVRDK